MQTRKKATRQTDMFHWDFVAGCVTGVITIIISLVLTSGSGGMWPLIAAIAGIIGGAGGKGLYAQFIRPWLQGVIGHQVPARGKVNRFESSEEQRMIKQILCTLSLHRWEKWRELDLGARFKTFGLRMQERHCEWCNYRQVKSISR